MDEVLFVAAAAGPLLQPLDFRVDRFAGCVRDPVQQVRHDVLESSLEHARRFDDRFQPAASCPVPAPAVVCAARPLIHISVECPRRLLPCPRPRRVDSAFAQRVELAPVFGVIAARARSQS